RRMRTRMYGGVRGRGLGAPSYSMRSGSLTAFRARRFDAPKHSLVEERVAQSSQGRVCMLQ
ncbi:hypothetical protein, partial [Ferroacidibacillus organovorans]